VILLTLELKIQQAANVYANLDIMMLVFQAAENVITHVKLALEEILLTIV
jgi:hypothetical protein